jgi:elongation factor G
MARRLKYTRNIELLLILMLVKQQQQSVFYSIRENHKIGEAMVLQQWTGWHKSKKETITSAATTCEWNFLHKVKCYLKRYLTTLHYRYSGHVDFTVEVNRSLRVLDGLVFLFSAVDGVEPQSETNWRLADQYKCHVLDSLIKWTDKDLTF